MAWTFTFGAFLGTTMYAGTPRHAAAQATAAPWFPLEGVTMPRAASSFEREKIAFVAPRILKEPVRCRFSHLKKSLAPAMESSEDEVRSGLRGIRGAIRA